MCDKQIPQHNYTIISIEGNIGAGKSTLLNYLKQEYPNLIFLDEPLDKWQSINHNPELNILQKYYENPKRWAYTFQIYAYQSRVIAWDQQIQAIISKSNKKHIFVTERSIESAREIFFKLCQEKGFINEIEYQVYDQFYQWFLSKNKQFNVDHFIYIETSPEECLRRINIRGRDEEKDIPLEYLQELHKKHVNWLGQTKNVVKLDGINNDRESMNKQIQSLLLM